VTGERLDRVLPLALAAGAAAYLWPLRAQGISLNDDGWWLQAVLRMRDGEVLYRDVWVFYAPLAYHAIEWLFALTGPSMLAARTLFAALIVASVVMTYRVARRFAPPSFAWIPAAAYGLAPGPWHKAYYGTCTIAILLCLARALEAPRLTRFAALGLMAGLALATRQDLGLLGLATALGLAALPALAPAWLPERGARSPADAARRIAAVLGGAALPVAPLVAYYASQGALGELHEATLVRAFAQSGAHPPVLGRLLAPATFAMAPEGRAVGVLMLLLPLAYAALAAIAARRVLRGRGDARALLALAIAAFGAAGVLQSWYPLLLLRLLQSALPFYLAVTILAWELQQALPPPRRRLPLAALGAAAATLVALVLFGLPQVRQPLYTGSARSLRYTEPVQVLGESFRESFAQVDEIRLVRAFYAAHTKPGEPTLAVPAHSLYHPLLDRANPTRVLAEHPRGNFVMTAAQKRVEASRLLASPARYAVVDQRWWARGGEPDPLLEMLRSAFHPARGYGSVLVLERGNDGEWRDFAQRLAATLARGPDPAQLERFRAFAETHPAEPVAWRMLAAHLQAAGDAPGAIDAWRRVAALDPADVTANEAAATLLAASGRRDEALAELARARAVRESPETRRLARALGAP
jgi:tetratricopeptide (TPR) repeat protein